MPSTATQIIVAMQISLVIGVLLGLLLVRRAARRAATRVKREADTVDLTDASSSPSSTGSVPKPRADAESEPAAVPEKPDGANR